MQVPYWLPAIFQSEFRCGYCILLTDFHSLFEDHVMNWHVKKIHVKLDFPLSYLPILFHLTPVSYPEMPPFFVGFNLLIQR